MELRVLQYFLTVAKEENITKAAETLHMSQPTLSRQLRELENELGKTLLIRGNKKTTLTEEGTLLQKRAQEIMELTQKTEAELRQSEDIIGGDVWIGGAETEGMRFIAQTANSLKKEYPNIRLNLISGNASDIMERLEKGLIDFGVAIGDVDPNKYETLRLPIIHTAGLLMRKDSPLASRTAITPEDVQDIPIISPRNEGMQRRHAKWLSRDFNSLNIVATFNLIYNATFLVEEGVGYAMCIDRLISPNEGHPLCFIPYDPPMEIGIDMVWKKHQVFSKASKKFLERLLEII